MGRTHLPAQTGGRRLGWCTFGCRTSRPSRRRRPGFSVRNGWIRAR